MKRDNYIIQINLESDNDIFNTFDDETISKNLEDHLYKKLHEAPLKAKINLHFNINQTNNDVNILKSKLKQSFTNRLNEKYEFTKMCNIRNIVVTIIGIIILSLYYSPLFSKPIISEILMITGWVLIWEVIYDLFFANLKRRYDKARMLQLKNASITINGK